MTEDDDCIEAYTLPDGSRLTICTKTGRQLAVIHRFWSDGVDLLRWPDAKHPFDHERWHAFLAAIALDTTSTLCGKCGLLAMLLCRCSG